MKKIVFPINPKYLFPGGVTSYFLMLFENLDKSKFEIYDLSLKKIKNFRFKEENIFNKIIGRFLIIFLLPIFFFKTRRNQYKIVHLNPSLKRNALIRDGIILLIAKLKKIPVVVVIHGWSFNCERKIRSNSICKWLFLKIFDKAEIIFVFAKNFKKSLKEIGLKCQIIVETTMVDVKDILKIDIKKKIQAIDTKEKINILFLSRIEKSKGIYEAIDTFILLSRKYNNLEFFIAGNGNEYESVKKYVNEQKNSNIKILGFVSGLKKKDVFLNSDIFLFPTYSEGLPISLLEAMAFGLAIVTRSVGGIPDVFKNGINGFLTISKSSEVLSELVERMIKNRLLLKKICYYNFKYANEIFSAAIITKRFSDIYENIIDNEYKRLNA